MSAERTKVTPLEAALRVGGHGIIFNVTNLQAVMAAFEQAARAKCRLVDARVATARELEAMLREATAAAQPVMVLLAPQLRSDTREVLDAVLGEEGTRRATVWGLTASGAVPRELSRLFTLQLAEASVVASAS